MDREDINNYNNSEKKLKIEDFVTKIVLGKGSFGKVVLVKKNDNNHFYAMKILKKAKLDKQAQVNKVIVERNILAGIVHPFIIKLYYSF
jgi:serine/threonine protein kinase